MYDKLEEIALLNSLQMWVNYEHVDKVQSLISKNPYLKDLDLKFVGFDNVSSIS